MATRKQIRANRRNARKSTGPKSDAGKAASLANALSHGLTAARTVVLPEEEPEDFERLRGGVIAELAPAGALQEALAQRIAVLLWRLDRVARLEAELFIHGEFALDRASLDSAGWSAAAARLAAEQMGPEAVEAHEERQKRKIHLEACMYAEAPCARVLAERRESARAFDQIARHEATLQRALDRTLAAFHRLRDAATEATDADAAPEAAPADPDPAPSRDERPPALQRLGVPAGRPAHGGEADVLQNEANSAQGIEEDERIGAGVNPPTAPPMA